MLSAALTVTSMSHQTSAKQGTRRPKSLQNASPERTEAPHFNRPRPMVTASPSHSHPEYGYSENSTVPLDRILRQRQRRRQFERCYHTFVTAI